MGLLPTELRLLVAIFITSPVVAALPHILPRDNAQLPCTGEFKALNTEGLSPGIIYQQLQEPCNRVDNPNASRCRCNIVAYNLNMASNLCQQNTLISWPEWADSNLCPNTTVLSPPGQVPYDTSALAIPKWASQSLTANLMFNQQAILNEAKGGWSPIQIAAPIIAAFGVMIIAIVIFFIYRARQSSRPRKTRQKAWRDANLQGHRRFFGLIPEVFRVRSKKVREPQWEIDGNVAIDPDFSPSSDDPGHERAPSNTSGHLRDASVTSLLTSHSSHSHSRGGRGIFSTLANKINAFSLGRNYKKGASKGPDYKRVQVITGNYDPRFRIDGGLDDLMTPVEIRTDPWASTSAPVVHTTIPAPTSASTREPRRDDTLPSVLDIRHQSMVGGGTAIDAGVRIGTGTDTHHESGQVPSDMYDMNDVHSIRFTSPLVERSDYSLVTADLQTPRSSSLETASGFPNEHRFDISSGSPFISSARRGRPFSSSPHTGSPLAHHRNQSTDSLAYELYPKYPH